MTVTSVDLAHQAHITYRQLDLWVRQGDLIESTPAAGPGTVRGFDNHEVAVARALRLLSQLTDPRHGARRGSARRRLAIHVRANGWAGQVEVCPGIIVDLDRLKETP